MSISTGKNHMWTKSEIRLIAELWKTKSKLEVARELGVSLNSISAIVFQMRKAGMVMFKKHKKGALRSLIFEIMEEDDIVPIK